jgi:hypothetical protein
MEDLEARERRAHPDGQAVIAAIGRERACGEIRHLPECERDHDEVDALGAQADDAGREREQRRDDERHGQGDQHVADAVRAEDADRIGAEPDEGRVTERDERAVADQQVERERRDGEDHHARHQAQHIGLAPEAREQGHDREDEKDRKRQRVAGEPGAPRR